MARTQEALPTLKPRTRSVPVGNASAWVSAGAALACWWVGAPSGWAHSHYFPFSSRAQPVQSKPQKVGRGKSGLWAGGAWTPELTCLPLVPHPYWEQGADGGMSKVWGNGSGAQGCRTVPAPRMPARLSACLLCCVPTHTWSFLGPTWAEIIAPKWGP